MRDSTQLNTVFERATENLIVYQPDKLLSGSLIAGGGPVMVEISPQWDFARHLVSSSRTLIPLARRT